MNLINSPDSPELQTLCAELASRASDYETPQDWPRESLRLCAEAGVFRWFLAPEHGGMGWSSGEIYRGYLQLSAACLTTTFIITQRTGACQRIAGGASDTARERYLPPLLDGDLVATLGISHLTTSRRHLAKPVLAAKADGTDWILDGFSPWVTGGEHADLVVIGASLDDGRELLAVLPTDLDGVSRPPSADLVGLSASCTGPVRCDSVRLPSDMVLAGPIEEVMKQGVGGGTGGLQTSILAIGHARASLDFVAGEAAKRQDLREPLRALQSEWADLENEALDSADGIRQCDLADLRARANSLALRASQSALAAAKGAGYLQGHPAGRWCREALFFLVWSCPQPVMNANLCELAGLESN